MATESWIEKGWGKSIDNTTIEDVKFAIEEIIRIDEEYGVFWVGHTDQEYVLKIHKNLDLFKLKPMLATLVNQPFDNPGRILKYYFS